MSSARFQSFDVLAYSTDTEEDNYASWVVDAQSALVLAGYWGILSGRRKAPTKTIDSTGADSTISATMVNPKWDDWLEENLVLLSCLRLRVGNVDKRLIANDIFGIDAWEKLKRAHLPSGALSQVTLLQQALAVRFTRDTPLMSTANKLQTTIDAFFAVKAPTEDEWRSIIFLNALAGPEFSMARSSLDTLLSAGTLTSDAIITRIRHEQVRIDAETTETATTEASFAAFQKRYHESSQSSSSDYPNGKGPCPNPHPDCKPGAKLYHDLFHCFAPGGSGVRKEKRGERGGRSKRGGKDKAKAAVEKDDGSESASVAIDSDARSFIAEDRECTSVDWNSEKAVVQDVALAGIDRPPKIFLDTGATSSICPVLQHFTSIKEVNRNVSGVGGSSIRAIGIGEVHIRIGKGRHFTLKDVLYCPEAAIHLISVGRVCDDGHEANFTSRICHVKQLRGGAVVATGQRVGTGLYTLNCESPIFTRSPTGLSAIEKFSEILLASKAVDNIAYAVFTAAATIATWHARLGHVNVRTIVDMAKGSAVTETQTHSKTKDRSAIDEET